MNEERRKILISDLSEKVMLGIRIASHKLVRTSAAEGRSLVIFENGEIKKVPARELLSRLSSK